MTKPVELWCAEDIRDVVVAMIISHDEMVEVRMEHDEREDEAFCNEHPAALDKEVDPVEEVTPRVQTGAPENPSTQEVEVRADNVPIRWPTLGEDARMRVIKEALKLEFQEMQERWKSLCDEAGHLALRDCITNGPSDEMVA